MKFPQIQPFLVEFLFKKKVIDISGILGAIHNGCYFNDHILQI